MSFIKLLTTNNPQRKLVIESQLMFKMSGKSRFLRKLFQRRIYYKYHCDISHKVWIPSSTVFVHPLCVVIGSNVRLGNGVKIYQGVTLGSDVGGNNEMPSIGDGCTLLAGAKIIGGITLGENVIVGANSIVTVDVPANSKVVGVNRILK